MTMAAKRKDGMPAWPDYQVHPAAKEFPPMSDAEIKELAEDIKANGLQQPIVLFRDNSEAAKGSDEDSFPIYILDGRNRIAALKLLGIDDPRRAPSGQLVETTVRIVDALTEGFLMGGKTARATWTPNVNPMTFVLSANIRRRHLTVAQKRDVIAKLIKAEPTWSNLKVARNLGVDDKTVASVRKEQGSDNPEIPNNPTERAAAALLANPNQANTAIGKAIGVNEKTVRTARKKLVESGELKPVTEPKPTTAPKPAPAQKKEQSEPKPKVENRTTTSINEVAALIAELAKIVPSIVAYGEEGRVTDAQKVIIKKQADSLHQFNIKLQCVAR